MTNKSVEFNKFYVGTWSGQGHTEIIDNEAVNGLAKICVNTKYRGPEPFCGIAMRLQTRANIKHSFES